MDLLALADFTLVARHGGFGKAARATRRPKATLSRRVAELEAALNLRLFERGQRDLKLTEEGRALAERAGALLAELEETTIEIAAGSAAVRGRLKISAPLLFSQTAMGRLAAGFAQRHPDVRLEVTTDDRAVDMIEEGYDLVIRVNPAADDALVGRPFLHDRLVVIAAPDLSPLAGCRRSWSICGSPFRTGRPRNSQPIWMIGADRQRLAGHDAQRERTAAIGQRLPHCECRLLGQASLRR